MMDVLLAIAISICHLKNKQFRAVGFDEAKNMVVTCGKETHTITTIKIIEFRADKTPPVPESKPEQNTEYDDY